jgi:hypothetical protein
MVSVLFISKTTATGAAVDEGKGILPSPAQKQNANPAGTMTLPGTTPATTPGGTAPATTPPTTPK